MYEKEIELAKSWFELAQIAIILAGFFFAIAGISSTNAQTDLSNAQINSSLYQAWINLSSANASSMHTSLVFGFILTTISIIFWVGGRIGLKRIR